MAGRPSGKENAPSSNDMRVTSELKKTKATSTEFNLSTKLTLAGNPSNTIFQRNLDSDLAKNGSADTQRNKVRMGGTKESCHLEDNAAAPKSSLHAHSRDSTLVRQSSQNRMNDLGNIGNTSRTDHKIGKADSFVQNSITSAGPEHETSMSLLDNREMKQGGSSVSGIHAARPVSLPSSKDVLTGLFWVSNSALHTP